MISDKLQQARGFETNTMSRIPDAERPAFHVTGSAVQTPDGKHLLMYTGVYRVIGEDGRLEDRQIQCVAIGDGENYEKVPENPVLTAKDLPEGSSVKDFRDPKIWYEPEEKAYYSVVGNRPADGSGSILLYRSEDGVHWNFVGILDECRHEYGRMWECPDFFGLDGKQAATAVIYTPQHCDGISFEAEGNVLMDVEKYDLAFDKE